MIPASRAVRIITALFQGCHCIEVFTAHKFGSQLRIVFRLPQQFDFFLPRETSVHIFSGQFIHFFAFTILITDEMKNPLKAFGTQMTRI
jgi:hypothetical protein